VLRYQSWGRGALSCACARSDDILVAPNTQLFLLLLARSIEHCGSCPRPTPHAENTVEGVNAVTDAVRDNARPLRRKDFLAIFMSGKGF